MHHHSETEPNSNNSVTLASPVVTIHKNQSSNQSHEHSSHRPASPHEQNNFQEIRVYSINQGSSKERLRKKILQSQQRQVFKANFSSLF